MGASVSSQSNQEHLDKTLKKAKCVRVHKAGVANGKLYSLREATLAFESEDPRDLESLIATLRIKPEPGGHCMCHGDTALEFIDAAGEVVALLGLHHGSSIRWAAWREDAILDDGMPLLAWLAERGVRYPLESFEADRRLRAEAESERSRWEDSIPDCLRALEPELANPWRRSHAREAAQQALACAYPDEQERIEMLFRWFGNGKGPWTGFPGYESVPEVLLLHYPLARLASVCQLHSDSRFLEGAARLFAAFCVQKRAIDESFVLESSLRQKLLEHVLLNPVAHDEDEDRIARARKAFSQ